MNRPFSPHPSISLSMQRCQPVRWSTTPFKLRTIPASRPWSVRLFRAAYSIGTTVVQCAAGDAAGNAASASFTVKVKGAPEQIVDLVQLAKGMALPTPLKTKLLAALQTALANPRNKPLACGVLSLFIQYVQAQPPSVIPPAKKAQMIADATRIKAVLGCS